jgi:hypothetical protein
MSELEPELERVARMLANAGPLPDAPATLRARAMAIPGGAPLAESAENAESAQTVVPIARRTWRRPRPLVLAGIAATVAAVAIVPAIALTRGDGNTQKRVDLVPRSFAPKGGGAADVVRHSDGSSTIKLSVWKMPNAGSGRTYEAWLGRQGERWPLGTFHTTANGKATITFRVARKDVNHYRWLWVTSEPAGGSTRPSEDTALWGPLT